jgi:hypothetical protein
MSDEFDPANYGIDPVQHANNALALSAFNGLIALLHALAKRGLLDEISLNSIHSCMSKPLGIGDPTGDNEALGYIQKSVDELLADLILLVHQVRE